MRQVQVMVENIEAILDRGDKIELLVDKSGDLSEQVIAPPTSLLRNTHPPWITICP